MRILLVAMYWPPAGGAGVARPLKWAKHLHELGFDVHVLAPDNPKWVYRDPTLRDPPGVTVHRAKNLGPRARRPAEELYGRVGLERLARLVPIVLRGLLVPDASVLWNLTATPAALAIVRRERIDVVVTTSPPGSVHLVGAAVRLATRARWVADLRDSLAAHAHRRREIRGEAALSRLVARRADALVAASTAIAREAAELAPRRAPIVVENGCDFDDFEGLAYRPGDRFRITHTGAFFGRRSPSTFLDALARTDGIVARFVGGFPAAERARARSLGLDERLQVIPFLPRADALALQRDSEALLLLVPDADGRGRTVLTAKIFEYLAAERPILAAVPPDGEAAELLRETGAGVVVPPDDLDEITAALADLERRWRAGELEAPRLSPELRARLARRSRVEELAALLHGL